MKDLDIKVWNFMVDNEFARQFLGPLSTNADAPKVADQSGSVTLCQKCDAMNFWTPQFTIRDTLGELKQKIQHCRWCAMRWEACKHLENTTERVIFDRVGSVIKLNESDPPAFSIFKSEDFETPSPIQTGRPALPMSPRETDHFRLIRQWLQVCDSKHATCRQERGSQDPSPILASTFDGDSVDSVISRRRKTARLPTRLLDLGAGDMPGIRLCYTQFERKLEDFSYIALSHPWGESTANNPHFCTTVSSLSDHLREIEFDQLPNTFKDAVTTTRGLGVRYLWIDSLCIVQGPGGDFNTESSRMEEVFSSAYCVIAASRALGQSDGFLKDRVKSSQNDYVTFGKGGSPPFFVSNFLDDFNNDVLEGSLNKRGWVLQERALARRTIYFTEKQTYFECGDGVRCETLTKMNNQLAAFLGDPNFPDKAIISEASRQETSRGQRILYYQDLYKTYSRLGFSHWEDRSVAMNGLEQRLAWGFKCRGKFGILDDSIQADHKSLLHRSLLWIRAVNKDSLRKIPFPSHRQKVPTWSWMAFQGDIDYLSVPFDRVDWDPEFKSPWQTIEAQSAGRSEILSIRAKAYRLSLGKPSPDIELVFNSKGQSEPPISHALCVVVGKAKGLVLEESRIHYVLLVRPSGSLGSKNLETCERIGAGSLPARFIDFGQPGYDVAIF